jgi:antibiotic biosynthesis monooxygenase (ABM) superfamily enzyme
LDAQENMNADTNYSDNQNGPVTISLARKVVSGREADYEAWLKSVSVEALKFPGHMGVNVIRPAAASNEYVTIFRFDSYEHSTAWEHSKIRQEWLERLEGIVEGDVEVREGTGLEFWFSLPELPVANPSPHKMALVLLVVVFALVTVIRFLLSMFASEWPVLAQSFVTVFSQVLLMTYVVMPRVTQLLQRWLYD